MSDLTTHAHDMSHHTSDHLLGSVVVPLTGTQDNPTTSTSGLPVPGVTLTVPAGDPRPYEVIFGANLYTDAIGQTAMLQLREDGNTIALAIFTNNMVSFGMRTSRSRRRRLPALVSHAYELWLSSLSGGNVHVLGYGAAGAMFIEALAL